MLEVPDRPLRHGYTTGACATACAKAAMLMLITQKPIEEVETVLPIGDAVTFSLQDVAFNEYFATAATIKDAGDDPDATHGAKIVATVSFSEKQGIELDGGVGVGRVTKPGLPVAVGLAAINPVPRRTILQAVEDVMQAYGVKRGVRVVISVPDGEEIAKKTLNARLGIIGGISILGTRGTVVPFSTSSYRASIVQGLRVAKEQGRTAVVLTTGGRSEKFAMRIYKELPEDCFIEMGDFVGFSAKQAKKQGFRDLRFVGMMGKFSKIAQGVMMVHAKSAPVDFDFLAQVADESGVPPALCEQIRQANTAMQVGDWMLEWGYPQFFSHLSLHCCRQISKEIDGGATIVTQLVTMSGEELGGATFEGEVDSGCGNW
ncbi:cobalt-precorrin-5B (C(1))-methyltransferase [Sulfoacidibacillus thermotolerans]|uniref:Cobalt-precorrin-5B C(1)-methyltransferase n=1 Tax=Sulfoacidibacillus thermotolerans TaxID=1765684 RepID=A0A2U3DCI7_SULT2|nr:cobalt-precorrin-5B (C(1))-methyltransferase [Sulfoacidibacillus thermotolerans]PWI58997.1 cobalt-precorrin-5B (C(1))-methyltransferase [Sulfoacidibacillus thermotolerans]